LSARPPPPPPATGVRIGAYTRQVRAYEPDDPALRKKRIKRFRRGELERISRDVLDLHKAMLRAMPEGVFDHDFTRKVGEVVHRYAGMDIDLWLDSVRVLKRTELRALIPGITLINVIGLAPLAEKALLEVDLRFVYRVVDKLLGGNGMAIDIHRPLTEIEQGVFSYVVLKVLALFHQEAIVSPEQVAIRLEDMRSDLKSAADIIRHEEIWVCAAWKMNFDLDVGYIRVLVPASLARRILSASPPQDAGIQKRVHDRIRRRMNRLAGVVVDAPVEAGRIELTRDQFESLDPGDIVFFDATSLRLEQSEPAGEAQMLVGVGRRAIIHGNVRSEGQPGAAREDKQLVFEISRLEIREVPPEHDPVVYHGEEKNPEEVIAEYEDHGDGESDDGTSTKDEEIDEDFGLDDENEGDDEEYEGEEGQAYQEGEAGYDDQGGGEEVPIDDSDNLAEAEPLLGDIPIAVIVELGRVQLTADEVIRLRAGQIIELHRSPVDPVDLVVAGKLLAKGELVEIDGALGVKILNLVKE
jgi:flagellar motor switch protein FliM